MLIFPASFHVKLCHLFAFVRSRSGILSLATLWLAAGWLIPVQFTLGDPPDGDRQPPVSEQATISQQDQPTATESKPEPVDTDEQASYQELDLFEAMQQDLVGVLVVPRDFSVLKMSLRNKTGRPLLIRAPEVFSAIPAQRVMAAQGGSAGGRGSSAGGYGPQASQGLGGSFYQATSSAHASRTTPTQLESSPQEDSLSQDNLPTWLLPPGRIVSQLVPCFCLEFGKPDPSPRIAYLLRPLTDLTHNSAVKELLIQFSRHQLPQRVTQLAVWHVGNQVPWNMLAKTKLPRSVAGRNQSFQLQELQAARVMVESLPAHPQRFRNPLIR